MPHWLPKTLALLTATSFHALLWLAVPIQSEQRNSPSTTAISFYKISKPQISQTQTVAEIAVQPQIAQPQIKKKKPHPKVSKKSATKPHNLSVSEQQSPQPQQTEPTPPPVFGLTPHHDPTICTTPDISNGNTLSATATISPTNAATGSGQQLPPPKTKVVLASELNSLPRPRGACTIPFPAEAEQLGLEGDVVLRLDIDARGRVNKVKLIKGITPILDQAAIRGIKSCHFIPAKSDGAEVAVIGLTYKYSFILD